MKPACFVVEHKRGTQPGSEVQSSAVLSILSVCPSLLAKEELDNSAVALECCQV